MYTAEPVSVALILTVAAVLMAASVALSHASRWTGVPVVLLFLLLGVIAGEEGIGRIAFRNYRLSFDLGSAALVLILFDGGLNTPLSRIRAGIRPAAVLATAGVAITAALVSVAARWFGFSWTQAMLLGAIVSPTDASAVFSILRGSGVQLKKRAGITLELESGLNDPMAVILTFALTRSLVEYRGIGLATIAELPIALGVGAGLGLAIGYGGRFMLQRMRPPAGGLYPVLTIALAFIAFGLPAIMGGSGFLAAYVAATAALVSRIAIAQPKLEFAPPFTDDTAFWGNQPQPIAYRRALLLPNGTRLFVGTTQAANPFSTNQPNFTDLHSVVLMNAVPPGGVSANHDPYSGGAGSPGATGFF